MSQQDYLLVWMFMGVYEVYCRVGLVVDIFCSGLRWYEDKIDQAKQIITRAIAQCEQTPYACGF